MPTETLHEVTCGHLGHHVTLDYYGKTHPKINFTFPASMPCTHERKWWAAWLNPQYIIIEVVRQFDHLDDTERRQAQGRPL